MFQEFKINLTNAISDLKSLLDETNKQIENLLKIENKTFENFLKPYQEIIENISLFFTPISHINSVKNNDETQKVYAEALPLLTEFYTKLGQNINIFNAFEEIYKKEKNNLNTAQIKLLEDSIRDFKNNGVHLPENQKAELMQINLELSELGNNFFQNVLNDTSKFEMIVEEKDVIGIPENDLLSAKLPDGRYKFTLQMPSYIAYITYGPNRELREKIYKAYMTRAPQNEKIIERTLYLRDKSAKILGFKNYAELSLSSKTANSPEEVIEFLDNLAQICSKYSPKEMEEITEIARKDGINKLESYDLTYYSEKLKKQKYNFNEDEYRPYFEKERVVQGLFTFLNKLFNLSFEHTQAEIWDEKVIVYNVKKNNEIIARIYLDLETRKDKRDGAWMNDWQTRHLNVKGEIVLPSAFIVANFPESSKEHPSLLRHQDVVTLFHETGHVLQHICSEIDEIFVSGINGVEWDVVEFPSQFLENFAYEKDVLKIFAKHYETGEMLPDEMIDKLIKIKNFNAAISFIRQLEFGLFDMLIHLKPMNAKEVQSVLDGLRKKYAPVIPPEYVKFQNQFSHIFSGGYAAGYYSYKWAERLSADAYFIFIDNNIFNKNIAEKFYKSVLTKGGSDNPMKLFKDFAGRNVQNEALIKLYGMQI
jgi:oligopeptidase A